MKCIRCNHDSKLKQRTNKICPGCKKQFAFEPRTGDPVTDALFKNAIDAVSGEGRIRWGVEHLYYEVCRRKRKVGLGPNGLIGLGIIIVIAGFFFAVVAKLGAAPVVIAALLSAALMFFGRTGAVFLPMKQADFDRLWRRWCEVHGTPPSFLPASDFKPQQARWSAAAPRPARATPRTFGRRAPGALGAGVRQLEPDIGDYSFDRAVICDRARTVDLLIANNFHFENNCAVLSIDGYPPEPFETIRTMLKRNPKLLVVTLHDATPDGCRLANHVAFDPDWFGGKLKVIDLGLRPNHAGPFKGLYLPSPLPAVVAGNGLSASEAKWFERHLLELAAIRPEQILKRLYNGLQSHANDDVSGGGTSSCGSFDSGSSHGSDDHSSVDSFG